MPKSRHRCVTNLSTSSKESLSSRSAIRSRAVSFPSARCRSMRWVPPPTSAARFISASCSTRDLAVTLAIPLLHYRDLLPVFQELLDTFIRQRVLKQRSEERRVGKSVDIGGRRIIGKKRKEAWLLMCEQ